jgi:hypothetical protein
MIFSSLNRLCFMALPPSSIQKWKIPVRNGPDLGGKVTSTHIPRNSVLHSLEPQDFFFGELHVVLGYTAERVGNFVIGEPHNARAPM